MKKHIYTISVIIAALILALMSFFDPLYSVDTYITDHIYSRLNGIDPRIVIIGIDEESLAEYGNFTIWSREKLAELVDKLYEDEQNAPAVVGLDFILTDHYDDTADAALVKAAGKEGRNVVVGTNIVYRGQLETDSNGRRFYNTEHVADIEMPFDTLNDVAVSGFTNACIAQDGYVRHSMNRIDVPDELKSKAGDKHESFAFAVYRTYEEQFGNRGRPGQTPRRMHAGSGSRKYRWGVSCWVTSVKIGLQDEGCAHFVDGRLVAPVHLLHAAVDHGPVGEHRGEALVLERDGNRREMLLEEVQERVDVRSRLGRGVVEIHGVAHHETLDRLRCGILFQIIYYLCRRNSLQGRSEDPQRIADRDADAFSSVIDSYDSVHILQS